MDGAMKLKASEYTVDDIYALPDGERAELIDGQIYMMSLPGTKHQKISFTLSRKIADYIDSKNGGCEVYPAPFAVFLSQDNKTYVEPDLSIICHKEKLDDRGYNGAPDWVVEIVSPSSRQMDYLIKLMKYQAAGVREYWIVDMQKNRIMVYNFEHENMEEYSFSDRVKAGIFEGLEIDFSELDLG